MKGAYGDGYETRAMRPVTRPVGRRILAALFLGVASLGGPATAQSRPQSQSTPDETTTLSSWGALPPGPHAVGFRTHVALDSARPYRTAFDDGATYGGDGNAPRPVLVNAWYPADAHELPPVMSYGDYFAIGSPEPDANRWARALSDYAADVACTEMLDAPVSELDAASAALWQRFLALPTRAHPDARPLDGPFPTVIYHSGAGSSYEDNSAFCEFLASHGFVVLGSAYPSADGGGFGIDSGDGSVSDMLFLAEYADSLPFADAEHLAYGGHSAGAQVCMRAQLRPDCPADAVFLLDTTIDYYTPSIPTWRYLTDPVLENVESFTLPLLVTAGPEASFQMCDALSGAERTYLTVPELSHNEFIQQGVLRLQTQEWVREGDARDADVQRLYVELCEAVRLFLVAELTGERAPFEARCANYATNALGGLDPCVEFAARGDTGAPPYDTTSDRPPTPRQLRGLLDQAGVDGLIGILERHLSDEPRSPPYTSGMLMGSLLYDLALSEQLDDARTLHAWLAPHGVNGVGTLRFLAFMSTLGQRTDRARHLLEVARDIDPADLLTLEELRKLDTQG